MPEQTERKHDETLGSDTSKTPDIRDNRRESRLELTRDGQTAILVYERTPKSLVLVHTEVPPALRGHHLGEALVRAGVEAARAEGLSVIATCPFAREYLRKHPS